MSNLMSNFSGSHQKQQSSPTAIEVVGEDFCGQSLHHLVFFFHVNLITLFVNEAILQHSQALVG